MDEGLGQISTQLTLADVELLREQAWGAARGAGALEPSRRGDVVALLGLGQGHDEAAQQERAFRFAQGAFVGPVAIRVAVHRQFTSVRVQRGEGARIVGWDRTADGG